VQIWANLAAGAAVLDVRAAVDVAAFGVAGVATEPGLHAAVDLTNAAGAARGRIWQIADLAAAAAALFRREQVGLAGVVGVAVALVGATRAVQRAELRGRIAQAALAVGGHETRLADGAAFIAERTATVHAELVTIANVVHAARAGAELVFGADLALTIHRAQARLAVATGRAATAAVGTRFVAVHHPVVAALLPAESLDTLSLAAVRRIRTLSPDLTPRAILAAAVDVGLGLVCVQNVICAMIDRVSNEMYIGRTARERDDEYRGRDRQRAATTRQAEQRHRQEA
jgi:hypothetical protein